MRIKFIQQIIDIFRGKTDCCKPIVQFYRKLRGSYSQYGEDLILAKYLHTKKDGFYVDIGANHPVELSNTAYFYERGFTGINIEANPRLIKKFNDHRANDVNLNIGISNKVSEMTFYVTSATTLGSFDLETVKESCRIHGAEIVDEIKVKTELLKNVLDLYAQGKNIDFMSVDVEGHDLEVLMSNDWTKYRPNYLIIETNINESDINTYIELISYKLLFKNHTNSIWEDRLMHIQ